jgi:hypothetical protein
VNQLISSLDPVSLAAELLSASLNASGYTYEIAPVASLVEEEVLKKLGGRCVRERARNRRRQRDRSERER